MKEPKLPGASKLNRTAARIKMAAPVWNQRLAENVSVEKGRVSKLSECRRSHWGRQLAQRDSEVISRRFIDLCLYYGPLEQSFSSELQILKQARVFFIVTIIIICWLFRDNSKLQQLPHQSRRRRGKQTEMGPLRQTELGNFNTQG